MTYRKSAETRNRLLEAAAKLFTERGYYDTGIGDITGEAGIGRASFYYYFDDKEQAARALFDSYVERIYATADRIAPDSPLDALPGSVQTRDRTEALVLSVLVRYILLFEYVALNEATHAVYFDLVDYAEYDAANIARLERTVFKDTKHLASAYGKPMSDDGLVAFILTVNSVAKSIFKGIQNGILGFSLRQAMEYFCVHAILPDIPVPEQRFRALLGEAFRRCDGLELD